MTEITKYQIVEGFQTTNDAAGRALRAQYELYMYEGLMKPEISKSTRRSYQSAIRQFERWGGILPSTPKVLISYLLDNAQSFRVETLSLRLRALNFWHEQQGFSNPVTNEVKKQLKSIEQEKGESKHKVATFTLKELKLMISNIDDDLKGLRDKALLLVGFFGALRGNKLIGLTVENIQKVERGMMITVPQSKAGQCVDKLLLFMQPSICPIVAIDAWRRESGIVDGPIFRSVDRWGKLSNRPLNTASVGIILKDRASSAGLELAPSFSAESLRMSLVAAAFKASCSLVSIRSEINLGIPSPLWSCIEEMRLFEDDLMRICIRIDEGLIDTCPLEPLMRFTDGSNDN